MITKREIRFVVLGFILCLFILTAGGVAAQEYSTDKAIFHLKSSGDLLSPAWSEDGNILFYQSNEKGNWDIFAYDFVTHSTVQITDSPLDEQHPVWWTNHHGIAFDSYHDGEPVLLFYRWDKRTISPLFRRNISCRQPSFDPEGRLVTFSGYDRETLQWQIFSYDFVYDNLNRLTKNRQPSVFPFFSPKGNKIIYQTVSNPADSLGNLQMINWYGDSLRSFDKKVFLKVCFSPDDWRIFYVTLDKKRSQLQSMRKDGTAVYPITEHYQGICCPAFSPDGKKLTVSIRRNGKYELFVFQVE